jgi:hypothetical protein
MRGSDEWQVAGLQVASLQVADHACSRDTEHAILDTHHVSRITFHKLLITPYSLFISFFSEDFIHGCNRSTA